MSEETYATIERINNKWQSRILESGKEPYIFEPPASAWYTTRGDLIRLVNQAHPSITYCAIGTFERLVAEQRQEASV